MLLAVNLGITGCGTLAPRPDPVPHELIVGRAIDERAERTLVEKNRPGRLLDVSPGSGRGMRILVHGIHASPATLQPIVDRAEKDGAAVKTFAYDDRYRRQTDSADDLARELGVWLAINPSTPLAIDAHSMGGRIALAALQTLADRGLLAGRDVELNLVAPPLGGFVLANFAGLGPEAIAGLIDGARPGIDMGTRSAFQRRLEAIALPETVRTTIYVAADDDIVDSTMPAFSKIAERLRATVIRVDGADHDSVIDRFAGR